MNTQSRKVRKYERKEKGVEWIHNGGEVGKTEREENCVEGILKCEK